MKNKLLLLTIGVALTSFYSRKERNHTTSSERISMVNESVWDIKAIYISEIDKNNWQENLLSDGVLSAGGGATIVKADCGTYDLKVIDTDNHTCTIRKVDLCKSDKNITITDQSIGNCLNN
jgi:hypothetical protein